MTDRKPLARYGAMESALRERLAPAELHHKLGHGRRPGRPRDLRVLAPDAAKILQGNVYGWFERIERGLYRLTSSGRVALVTWAEHVSAAPRVGFGEAPTPERMA